MSHDAIQELLSGYLDGDLPAEERARVEEHLDACAECREELELLQATLSALHDMPRLRAPGGFFETVMERVGAEDAEIAAAPAPAGATATPSADPAAGHASDAPADGKVVPLRRRTPRVLYWAPPALAAAACLMVGLVWWMIPRLSDGGGYRVASRELAEQEPMAPSSSPDASAAVADVDALADAAGAERETDTFASADEPARDPRGPAVTAPPARLEESAAGALQPTLEDDALADIEVSGDGEAGGFARDAGEKEARAAEVAADLQYSGSDFAVTGAGAGAPAGPAGGGRAADGRGEGGYQPWDGPDDGDDAVADAENERAASDHTISERPAPDEGAEVEGFDDGDPADDSRVSRRVTPDAAAEPERWYGTPTAGGEPEAPEGKADADPVAENAVDVLVLEGDGVVDTDALLGGTPGHADEEDDHDAYDYGRYDDIEAEEPRSRERSLVERDRRDEASVETARASGRASGERLQRGNRGLDRRAAKKSEAEPAAMEPVPAEVAGPVVASETAASPAEESTVAGNATWILRSGHADVLSRVAALCQGSEDLRCSWLGPLGKAAPMDSTSGDQAITIEVTRRGYDTLKAALRGLGSVQVRAEQVTGVDASSPVSVQLTIRFAD